jgi:hypothetical protein
MTCDLLQLAAMRTRTAVAAARGGHCDLARESVSRAGRDVARFKAKGSMTPCAHAFMKGVVGAMASARRQVRARCER